MRTCGCRKMARHLSIIRAKVWLFSLKHLLGKGSLTINVIREICSYIAPASRELVQVSDTFMSFFNWQASNWGPRVLLSTLIRADDSSTWVVLENGCLFCSGGGKCQAGAAFWAWSGAYLLSRTGAVDKLSLITGRAYHGVIQVGDIYIFGGCTA